MNRNLITLHVVFGVLVVCMFFGCKNKPAKSGSDISDNSEEQVDTLAELAKHIDEFESISGFIDGYAEVRKDGKNGVISKTGIPVVECIYEYIDRIEAPYVVAKMEGKVGVVEFGGDIVCDFIYDDIFLCRSTDFHGLAIVESNGRSGIINLRGSVLVPCKYEKLYEDDGLFYASTDGKYGWIDSRGNIVIPFKYFYDSSLWETHFTEGLAIVLDESNVVL